MLWVSDFAGGTLVRVDPRTLAVWRSPKVCTGPQGLLVTPTRVWVACTTDGTVVAVDPANGQVRARVPVGEAPDPVAAGPAGTVLIALQQGPTLVQVNPSTARVTSRTVLGHVAALNDRANIDVVVAGRTAWVSSFVENRVYRVAL
jgi:YVTN family beta-propeller protein